MTTKTITADAAGTWQLGDHTVNRLGFGAMRLSGRAAFHLGTPRDRGQSIAVLRKAVELGVNHIDTAAFYFSSLLSANEIINSALSPYREDIVVVTKVGPHRDYTGQWGTAARPDQLRGQVEENLRQLGRDHLDVVNLRYMRQPSIAEHFGALAELREAGLVRHLGISGVRAQHLAEALEIAPVVCVQNRYGLGSVTPDGEEMLRLCGERGIAFVPFYSVTDQGPRAATDTHDDEVVAVARAHGVSPAQVRIAWTLGRGPHVLAIPGTGDPDHLVENVAAAAVRLTEDELRRLDALHESVAESSPKW